MMYDEDLMHSTQKRLQWEAEGRLTDESSKCIEE